MNIQTAFPPNCGPAQLLYLFSIYKSAVWLSKQGWWPVIFYSLDPPRTFCFFKTTSVHFITHPLPMPPLFQPSCLYQHDTSLGLVSSPSCSESGRHSLNPQYKHPLYTDPVCTCVPTRKADIPNGLLPKKFHHDYCGRTKNWTLMHYLRLKMCVMQHILKCYRIIYQRKSSCSTLVYSLWQIH